jgi:DNA end-binding protein Ku
MARPFWSGQLRISLVSFGIQLFPATEAKGEIHFHQLNRKTGERVKHQNVSGDEEPLEKDEIVKGYEYSKGQYVMIEPEDIDNLRIPSRQTLDLEQFAAMDEIDPEYFEKPYFVTPENAAQSEAFAVVRKALQTSGKVGLGKIAFGGREHLMAISPPEDDKQLGMMAYTLRYAEELRDSGEYFSEIKSVKVDEDQLELAKELIKRKTSRFDSKRYKDEYEDALRAMVDAKVKHLPAPKEEAAPKSTKVINLMDALRKSVRGTDDDRDKKPAKSETRAESGVRDRSAKVTVMKAPHTGKKQAGSRVSKAKSNGAKRTPQAKKNRSA